MPKPFHVPGPELSRGDEAGERDDASGLSGASLEVVPKKKRKQYPASEKLRIVKAADSLPPEPGSCSTTVVNCEKRAASK